MKTETKKSYQEGLSELRSHLREVLPLAALSVFDEDAAQLKKVYPSVLKILPGEKAPDFTLPNALGEQINLYRMLKDKRVVLVFYRGTWCPYCNLQLSLFQSQIGAFHSLGATLIAISPQNPDSSLSMQEKNALTFEVLSDSGNVVARRFTTVFRYKDEPAKAMADLGYDFDSFYQDDSREIPVPAVFVVGRGGEVLFAQSEGGDYRNRVEVEEIIEVLKNS